MQSEPIPATAGGDLVIRHRLFTRIWHWINAAALLLMLMSGLTIFNAHPRLYWGRYGANPDPAWLEIGTTEHAGYLRVDGAVVPTTGVLGLWKGPHGRLTARAFPYWATIPGYFDLAAARRWHLSLAWLVMTGTIIFGLWSLVSGHVRRDLLPCRREMAPRHIWCQIRNHALLRLPRGEEARSYNVLQKIVYLGVAAGLIPILIITGLTMSPRIDAALPWLLDLCGGRQSARSIHFIAAAALVLFVVFHLLMVVIAGPFNEMRSMITGRFRLPEEKPR